MVVGNIPVGIGNELRPAARAAEVIFLAIVIRTVRGGCSIHAHAAHGVCHFLGGCSGLIRGGSLIGGSAAAAALGRCLGRSGWRIVAAFAAIALAAKGQLYAGFWDAVDFWLPKAQAIYYGHGIPADAWASIKHPEYPPLLPTLDAAIFHFTGGFHPSVLPLQAVLLGIAFLLAMLALLDGLRKPPFRRAS